MNLLLRIAIFLCLSFQCFAQQPFEYIYSTTPFSTIRSSLLVGDDLYIAGAENSCFAPAIRKVNFSDNDYWSTFNGGHWMFDDLFFLPHQDSTFITGGYYQRNDDFADEKDGIRILTYSVNGEILLDSTILMDENLFGFLNLNFTINGEDEIIVTHLDTLYRISLAGTMLNKVDYPFSIFDIIPLNDSTLVATYNSTILWLNNNGDILSQQQAPGNLPVKGLEYINGRAYGFSAEQFFEITSSMTSPFELITNVGLFINPEGITGNNNSLFIWGKDQGSDLTTILECDLTTGEINRSETLELEDVEVADVKASATQLFISGNFTAPGIIFNTSFVKAVNILNFNYYDTDISLDDVRITSPIDISYKPIPDDSIVFYSARPLIYEFDVTNHSPDTLTSFGFYSDKYGGFNCSIAHVYNYISGIKLPPGESLTLTDSSFNYITSTKASSNYVPSLEFYVYAPNHHFDGDRSNNERPTDLILSTDDDLSLAKAAVKLYPNPANEELQIELPDQAYAEALQLAIFDMQGKRILEQSYEVGQVTESLSISTLEIPIGMYFVQLQVGEEQVNKKLLIQR